MSRLGLATHHEHTITFTQTAEETRTIFANKISSTSNTNSTATVLAAAGPSIPAAAAQPITLSPNPSTAPLATVSVVESSRVENGPPPGAIRIQPREPSPQDESELPQGMGSAPPAKDLELVVAAAAAAPSMGEMDPADAGFLGGSPPNTTVDLPITIVFLVLFVIGAFTHISIYKANSKRGHKFLLSDLMFDFCMVRTVTCIFRIIWVFIHPRGIILCAQLFFNGGAAVIFAVNVILTQRIVRSMHPKFGWSRGFSIGTRILALSVPVNILFQIGSLIGLFFSVGDSKRLEAFSDCLKVGSSWNLFLVSFPFLAISAACAVPGPRPEKFGAGSLRVKTSMVLLAAVMLGTGATIRSYATFNPRMPDTTDVLYSKAVFYPTQFTLEILVVALYALLRFDLLFHIPNGSRQPGDYTNGGKDVDPEKAGLLTRNDIEERIANCGVPYQILKTSYEKNTTLPGVEEPIYAIFFPSTVIKASAQAMEEALKQGEALERPKRVSRRQSLIEALERRSERDRKAVGRTDRRSVASRRSHWGYAHLREGSAGTASGTTQVPSRGVDRSGARSRTPAGEYINFEAVHNEEWVLPEYPRNEKAGGYSRYEKEQQVVYQSQRMSESDVMEVESPAMALSPSEQLAPLEPRSRSMPTSSYYPPERSPERPSSGSRDRGREREREREREQPREPRERVPSVAQIKAERGSSGSNYVAAPSRPPRDLQSMYHAGQDTVLRPPNPGHKGRH